MSRHTVKVSDHTPEPLDEFDPFANDIPDSVKSVFSEIGIRQPDIVVIPDFRNHYPQLIERGGGRDKSQWLSGAYLWIDEGWKRDNLPRFLYAGKAKRIKNRIQQHWSGGANNSGSEWLDLYWEKVWSDVGYSGVPLVYVWFDENGASIERILIEKLSPMFNRRID